MSGALLRYLARRYAALAALCALPSILIGVVVGFVWPDWRQQIQLATGAMRIVRTFLRDDLIPPEAATFGFQLPYNHPLTILAMLAAMALPTIGLPAGLRGKGSLDLLLATPLTRRRLVATTFAFSVPFAALVALAPLLGVWIGGHISDVTAELPFAGFAKVSVELFLLALFFAGLTQLLSVVAADAGRAIGRLAAVIFWSLLAEVVGTAWLAAGALKYLTPLGYYEPAQVLSGVAHYARDCAILGGAGLLFFALAVVLEDRRRSA